MLSLTRRWARDTIRNLWAGLGLLLLTGCATSGPNHVYLTVESDPAVHDVGPQPGHIARAVAPGERVLGLAYDFNTDHLFLRIAPAQIIRVLERPSGKILRELPLPPELRTENPADLAIRSRDRHLFAVHPDARSVVELTLIGTVVRHIVPPDLRESIGGLAYDQIGGRLLVLMASNPGRIGAVAPDGSVTYYVTLSAPVAPRSLGYDSDARHYFVPLQGGRTLGEFDSAGKLVATHQITPAGPITALDAGPRSFVRVF